MQDRGRPRVRLTNEDLDLTAAAIIGAAVGREPRTAEELVRPFGRTKRERITVAARELSARQHGAYRSSRRRFERYLTTSRERRTPRPAELRRLWLLLRRPDLDSKAALLVQLCADVFYVGQHKCPMPTNEPQEISARELAPVRAALRAGDTRKAARALLDAFVYQYGLRSERNAEGVIGNISEITAEIAGGQ